MINCRIYIKQLLDHINCGVNISAIIWVKNAVQSRMSIPVFVEYFCILRKDKSSYEALIPIVELIYHIFSIVRTTSIHIDIDPKKTLIFVFVIVVIQILNLKQ